MKLTHHVVRGLAVDYHPVGPPAMGLDMNVVHGCDGISPGGMGSKRLDWRTSSTSGRAARTACTTGSATTEPGREPGASSATCPAVAVRSIDVGDDPVSDEAKMVEVGQVEDLEVDPVGTGGHIGVELLGDLFR